MLRRLGYACRYLSLEHGSPRGTTLRNASPERLRGLIELNLATLKRVTAFNVDHGGGLFRISSDVVPFGSHPVNRRCWWAAFRGPLREIGKLVIHVGGASGDKEAALNRWIGAVSDLPGNVRARVVLENDERLFGADDVLRASAATGTPVVLDVFHHRVYAGPDAETSVPGLIHRAAATWDRARDGVPKIHYSSQAEGRRPGAHAEYVDPAEFARFLTLAPAEVQFDCMLEAEAKDRAPVRLRETLGIAA